MAKKKILMVEDDVMLVEIIRMLLEEKGYDVVSAENGKEGLLKALSDKPDLIVADIMMPEMDGIEMTKIIRSTADLKELPIIVLTALGRDSDVKKAMNAGATDYLVKPASTNKFLQKIQEHLK
ncbi:MAG: response regulator [Pseudomonadota bacterium]